MKISGYIHGGTLVMVVESGQRVACIERMGTGNAYVEVRRDGITQKSTHATLDAAVACAQEAVDR